MHFIRAEPVWIPGFDIAFYEASAGDRILLSSFENAADEGRAIRSGATHAMVSLKVGPFPDGVLRHDTPAARYTFVDACIA